MALLQAFIGVGGIDLIARKDIEHSQRMMMAWNAIELVVVSAEYHCFDVIAPDASVSWNDAIRRAFTKA